jgi:hypothetical protein
MTAKLKNFLVIVLKTAVNAVLTNAALMTALPGVFNFHDHNGLINILKLTGSVIGARELAVWVPILLSWSQTSSTPSVNLVQLNTPKPAVLPGGPPPKPPVPPSAR